LIELKREPLLDPCFDHGAVSHRDRDLDLAASIAPLVAISQAAISASPSPPCLKIFSPIFRPSSFVGTHDGSPTPSRRRRTIVSD
jgi:hypothetical protein